jgi:hypothetical protein
MATEKPEQDIATKLESLSKLREEIDTLEIQLTENKRKELILAEERSQLKSIYKWKAPERPFNPKSKNWYIGAFSIAIVAIILAILTETYLLVVAIIAVLVVVYAMNTVPPEIFEYEITNKGVKIANQMHLWRQIPRFWIADRGGDIFINFEALANEPRIIILAGEGNINIIAKELVKYIDYLSPAEVSSDFLMRLVEGKHKNISDFYEDTVATPIQNEIPIK